MSLRNLVLLCAAVALFGCPRSTKTPAVPSMQAETPEEALRLATSRRPERFKMVHQVGAAYNGQTFVMSGYLLGRTDGSFRVSASAPVGPRLFDVGRLNGQWQSNVHLKQISERLDPKNMATAINRIYFAECRDGGERKADQFVYHCALDGDDEADALEMTIDGRTLGIVSKHFTLKGQPRVDVVYAEPDVFGQEWQARKIHMSHYGGLRLDVALVEYQPGFAFEDGLLDVGSRLQALHLVTPGERDCARRADLQRGRRRGGGGLHFPHTASRKPWSFNSDIAAWSSALFRVSV